MTDTEYHTATAATLLLSAAADLSSLTNAIGDDTR